MLLIVIGVSAMAQQSIRLRSTDRAECVSSDMTSLRASFSFSTIEAEDYESQRGTFSWLSLANTVIGGNEGDPQIPVVNELIAVPFGAQPRVEITSFSTTDYRLEDYGMHTLVPRQPSLRKDKRLEDVPFIMNQAAYQTRGFRSEPRALVTVVGTMRGVQLGKLTIEPVSYDPVNNTMRVFNDIEVTVYFDGADRIATEQMLVNTYSPYFNGIYSALFNGRAVLDAYTEHPDLYNTPVKMLVVATSDYQNSTAFQNWLTWKKQKGIDVDIYTVTSSTASSTIQTEIYSRYNANHPSFLVIVGDETVVKAYKTNWSCGSTYGNCINDLEYASVDGDVYHDMFMSRMSVSSTTELGNLVNKILTYEKYTMSDPSYLSNSLLIAGWDSSWTSRVGKPTIQYANNNYYNSAHGINPTVYITTASGQTAAYNNINNVGFMNYTAHGDIQELADPEFTNSNANNMTNNDKYLWVVANCCLSANWGNSSYSPCLGETMIRAANKGAFGYIGSIPESYWYEDYYFGIGAFAYVAGTVQTPSSTTTGMYDAAFDDTGFNTLNSMPYIGNVAVTYAHAAGYQSSVTDEYYWRAYQCLGDGSVMPYLNNPAANNVSHASSIVAGTNSFRVNADAGSYVAITVNNNIIGVAAVPANATYVNVPFTTTPTAGTTAMIVVTRNQRQPYINTNVPVINNNAPQYTITTNVTPATGGTVEGGGTYYENTDCTLTAVANHGYAFQKWNDNNTDNPRTFTVTGNATYTATFRVLEQHHINYTAQQTHGTISASPTDAYMGDVVTLTATPDLGYGLDYWTVTTGRETIPVENNQFIMPDSDVTVSATFKLEPVTLTVYDGTATNQFIPMYGYYFDDFTKSECIIPASQLTAMTGCPISAITFYPSSVATTNSTWSSTSQTVFLKEISGTTLGGGYSGTTGATIVKQALLPMPTAGTAYTITFDTPYAYNGGNLLIGVYNTDDGSYNKVEWYGTSNLDSGVSAYGSDGSSLNNVGYNAQAFLPKTTFTYTPSTIPYLSLTPNSATVITGATETLTATYGNVSGTPSITYSSSNTNVATVIGSGTTATVTGVAPGTATITASMTVDGTPYTATCDITVSDPSTCEGFETDLGLWTVTADNSSYAWARKAGTGGGSYSSAGQGSYNAAAYASSYVHAYTYLTLNQDLSSFTDKTISFMYINPAWSSDIDYIYLQYTTDGTTYTDLASYTSGTSRWTQVSDLAIPDEAKYIRFAAYGNYGYGAGLDEICLDYTTASTDPVEITVSANPEEGGTVTGAGTYDPGTQCTLTATANEGYTFTNWTRNGVAISTNATYTFTVSAAAEYVANFTLNSYMITATANPAEGGVVSFGGRGDRDDLFYDFEDGWQGWTTFQGNTTSPNSWMHNTAYPTSYNDFSTGYGYNGSDGFMLSESYISGASSGSGTAVTPDNYLVSPQVRLGGSISFYAGARNTSYCAEKFSVMVSTTDNTNPASFTTVETWILTLDAAGYTSEPYVVDLSAFSGMGYIAIRHFDCYDQWFLAVDNITIVEGQDNSSANGNFNYGETCVVTATPNADYYFVNWTENGTPVSTSASYSFTVTGDRDLVANFSQEEPLTSQTYEFVEGWNWWSPNIDITLADFETSLGANGVSIINQDGLTVSYNANNGWGGDNITLEVGKMYMVKTNATCTVIVGGNVVDPSEHDVTLHSGANWIGLIGTEEISLDEAFINHTPSNLDMIKTTHGIATYYQGRGWRGSVTTLVPGEGVIYVSKSSTQQTFNYPSAK